MVHNNQLLVQLQRFCKLCKEKPKHSLPGIKMSETIKFTKQRNSYRLICKFSPPLPCRTRTTWYVLDLLWMGHCVLPSWTFVKCAIEYLTWVYVEWIEIKLICKLKTLVLTFSLIGSQIDVEGALEPSHPIGYWASTH